MEEYFGMQSNNIDDLRWNALQNALDDALLSLGISVRNALLGHMNQNGVEFDSKDVDIELIYSSLRDLIGPGADLIMDKVFERLQHYGSDIISGIIDFQSCTSLEKIQGIMKMMGQENLK
jgi:hypothetical protein